MYVGGVRVWLLAAVVLFLVALFFSYRLLEVPTGLTIDEVAFGYNAVLLARDGRDQNGWKMPVFVLSIDGKEWRQPVPQYYMALFFRLFGASMFNLRFTSVVVTLVSVVLIFILGRELLGTKGGVAAGLMFLMTPQVMIQSHLALDNITMVPFVIGWLIGLLGYQKNHKLWYLTVSAVCLGFGFYTYKGMRGIVPVWSILTVVYLAAVSFYGAREKFWKSRLLPALVFGVSMAPFFLVIPSFERTYPCAVFDCQKITTSSFYDFFYPYISSFDLSFLFIKGDMTIYHSTGRHGMLLLASLPLFLIGLFLAIKRKGYWLFLVAAFFCAPLLFGLVNSVFRASRLMAMIPPYALIASLGVMYLWERRKSWLGRGMVFLMGVSLLLNYVDFVNFYWYTYPKFSENVFGDLGVYKAYVALGKESKERGLRPYVATGMFQGQEDVGRLIGQMYFGKVLPQVMAPVAPSPGAIILTHRKDIPGMEEIGSPYPDYHLLIN